MNLVTVICVLVGIAFLKVIVGGKATAGIVIGSLAVYAMFFM